MKRGERLIAYFEVYEPLLNEQPQALAQAHMRIVNVKTGATTISLPSLDTAPYKQPGSSTIPTGEELVFSQLPKGDYGVEVQATDSAGRSTPWRPAISH